MNPRPVSSGPALLAQGRGADGLEGRVRLSLGSLELDVALSVPPDTTTAVLGPNGAGKTSLLRVVAGLEALTAGHLSVGGAVVDDPTAGRLVAPEARRVALVPQDHLLFEHLSVLDNVAFGPRCRGAGRRSARRSARQLLDLVGLADRADVKPSELSGGQSQRVALARALAAEPDVLLLDEPLAALDASARPSTRAELRHWLDRFGGATLLVTHDPLDAYALADDLVVLEAGSVTQAGSLADVTTRPRTRYVADLVGTNLIQGMASGHEVRAGSAVLRLAESADGPVFCTVSPAAVMLAARSPGARPPAGSPRNHWPLTVTAVESLGERMRVALTGEVELTAELTAESVAELDLRAGAPVWASAKATEVVAYPR